MIRQRKPKNYKVMKTLKAILILAAAVSLNTAAATEAPKTFRSPEVIKKSIPYPDFAKQTRLQGFVAVEYAISSDGRITVLNLNTSDKKLGEYVRRKLENTVISNCEHEGIYHSKFNFRYIGH